MTTSPSQPSLLALSMLGFVFLACASAGPGIAAPGSACPEAPAAGSLQNDALRLAAARCELRAGDAARASALLEPLSTPSSSELHGYASLLGAEAALQLGAASQALDLLQQSPLEKGAPGRRALYLRARASLASEQPELARAALQELLDSRIGRAGHRPSVTDVDPAAVRWMLAEEALEAGDRELAVKTLEKLWTHNPSSEQSRAAAARLTELGQPTPDASSEAGRALILIRATTLQGRHLHKEALALRDLLPAPQGDEELGVLAKACFSAKDYPRAVALYGRLGSPSLQQRFDHALATSRTGDYEAAAQLYGRLVALDGKSSRPSKLIDKASFKLGYLDYDAGQLESAIAKLREHLARYTRSRHGDEARWFIAWSLVRLERFDEAALALDALVARHPSSSLAAAGRYWRARTAGLQGDSSTEEAGLREVVEKHPTTSYAWFASERLGLSWEPVPAAVPPPPSSELDLDRVQALAAAGLRDWARFELEDITVPASGKDRSRTADVIRSDTLALAHAHAQAGAWSQAKVLAKPWCSRPHLREGDPAAQQLCWPRPHGERNTTAALAGGLGPHLPFAIMKTESGWKPWVTSPAGARGIMQLMPHLAAQLVEERHPGSPFHPDDLYDAELNSELGVAELVSLVDRLADLRVEPSLPLAIAGYNGGEEAVRRWHSAYSEPPEADRFAEDIGYSETRRYVRKVLGTLQTYRYVYGDPEEPGGR